MEYRQPDHCNQSHSSQAIKNHYILDHMQKGSKVDAMPTMFLYCVMKAAHPPDMIVTPFLVYTFGFLFKVDASKNESPLSFINFQKYFLKTIEF